MENTSGISMRRRWSHLGTSHQRSSKQPMRRSSRTTAKLSGARSSASKGAVDLQHLATTPAAERVLQMVLFITDQSARSVTREHSKPSRDNEQRCHGSRTTLKSGPTPKCDGAVGISPVRHCTRAACFEIVRQQCHQNKISVRRREEKNACPRRTNHWYERRWRSNCVGRSLLPQSSRVRRGRFV